MPLKAILPFVMVAVIVFCVLVVVIQEIVAKKFRQFSSYALLGIVLF